VSEDIRSRLVAILVNDLHVPASKIRDDGTFRGTFGMDSLEAVDFVELVQKTFQFKAPLSEFSELHTLGALVAYLAQRLG
jgi:acyl carrier protein